MAVIHELATGLAGRVSDPEVGALLRKAASSDSLELRRVALEGRWKRPDTPDADLQAAMADPGPIISEVAALYGKARRLKPREGAPTPADTALAALESAFDNPDISDEELEALLDQLD